MPSGRIFSGATTMRGFFALFGLVGCVWAYVATPVFWSSILARSLTSRIQADERLSPGSLRSALERIERHTPRFMVQSETVKGRALVQLRIAKEDLLKQGSQDLDERVGAAIESLNEALSLLPADSFLWLMLYSEYVSQRGIDAVSLKYLERSYSLGPLEGWISLRRNRLSLAAFPFLSQPMRDNAVSEFSTIVDGGLIEDAADILVSTGWSYRHFLLPGLQRVDPDWRKALSKRLWANGIKVEIPGVDVNDRPWH